MKPILYIVIPCYNEEEVLPITKDLFLNKLKELISKEKISDSSRVMFVNDGSKDSTWEIIKKLALEDDISSELHRVETEDIRMQFLQV